MFIHSDATIGLNNKIGPNVYIGPNVIIGDNNIISGFSSIGMEAEHRDYFSKSGKVIIGNNNVIREFTTINSSTHGITKMGDRCVMLRGSHLSHDSELEDDVNVSCNVLIGGETLVMRGANLGLGCIIHQKHLIGSYSMVGMGSVVPKSKKIVPGNIYVGSPARLLKENSVGLLRNRIGLEQLMGEMRRYERLLKERC
jgi:UDP-N-acetylglucosamine acyltransferase